VKAIEIVKLVKEYRSGVRALDGLSLEVGKGEIFALLGPNGAGKSSLINILTTYYRPTAGKALVLGQDVSKEAAWVRTRIACVVQRVSVDDHLSLMETLLFQSRLYKIKPQVAKNRIATLLDSFELAGYLKYPVASYSGGVKRRLDIAMNLVSSPEILFLDEPTAGLDVESRQTLWKMLVKVREQFGTTIFLTTHYLEEADHLSDTICIMKNGREVEQGFFQLSEQEFSRQLAELKKKVPDYTDEQIEIELSLILAGIGDTHTGASIGSERKYPLQLHWFEEGIYIMGTSKEYSELLDARIITLNGKKIEEAAEKIKPLLGEANESWFKTQIIYYRHMPLTGREKIR